MRPAPSSLLALALSALAASAPLRAHAGEAQDRYAAAKKLFHEVRNHPKDSQDRMKWLEAVKALEHVSALNQEAHEVAKARHTCGQIFRKLAKLPQGSPADLATAGKYFAATYENFPKNTLADDALTLHAVSLIESGGDKAKARALLDRVLKDYAKGDQVKRAQAVLAKLGEPKPVAPALAAAKIPAPPPAPPAAPPPLLAPAQKVAAEPAVQAVTISNQGGAAQAEIALTAELPFTSETLPASADGKSPHRVFFDFKGTLGAALAKPVAVNGPVVTRVRTGTLEGGKARVVFDLTADFPATAAYEDNPPRLVVRFGKPKPAPTAPAPATAPEPPPAVAQAARPAVPAEVVALAAKPETTPNLDIEALLRQPVLTPPPVENLPPAPLPVAPKPAPLPPPEAMLAALPGSGPLKAAPSPAETPPVAMRAPPKGPAVTPLVVIDPGHGGHDQGAHGKGGALEKDVTLAVSKELAQVLRGEHGFDTLLTREDDEFIKLEDRRQMAVKAGAALFVSIHCDANPKRSVRGVTTYYLNNSDDRASNRVAARENAMSDDQMSDLRRILLDLAVRSNAAESAQLANRIQSNLVRTLSQNYDDIRDIGVRGALFMVLLGEDSIPSVLVETSFISNPDEEKRLKSPAYQGSLAKGIAKGIANFLKNRKVAMAE